MNPSLIALDFLTRALQDDPQVDNDTLHTAIRSGQVPWEAVVSLANQHLLTPALWVALEHRGLAEELPEDLAHYLQELHRLSTERNRHLRQQLLEAARQLNSAGIVPVLLKGAKHLVTDMYRDPGIRIMSDIDLLVRRAEIPPAHEALQALGYRPLEDIHDDYHDEHHHCAPLYREGDYGTLELHRGLAEKPFDRLLPLETALAALDPLEIEGARMTALSATHRLLHNLVHSQLIDHLYADGIFPLRSLHETVHEYRAAGADWPGIRAQMQQHRRVRAFDAHVFMAHRLFAMPLPPGIHPGLHGRLHYRRCRWQLAWRPAHEWGLRLGRYSADRMAERYGCGRGWLSVNRARLRRLTGRVARLCSDWSRTSTVPPPGKQDKA